MLITFNSFHVYFVKSASGAKNSINNSKRTKGLISACAFVVVFLLCGLPVTIVTSQGNSDESIVQVSSYKQDDKEFMTLDVFDYTKMKNATNLEISSSTITEIPSGIFNLIELEELKVNYSGITAIRRDIRKLNNLRVLNLSNTSIGELPEEIEQLIHLQELYLPIVFWVFRLDEVKKITKAKIILE